MLRIRDLTKGFGGRTVVDGLSLEVDSTEIRVVAGLNGSGKSTLLKLVAGLLRQDSGQVVIDGRDVSDHAPEDRQVGYVPQRAALFRHLSVAENISYCLRNHRGTEERISRLIEMMDLQAVLSQKADTLSGGFQSRVSLARSMASSPRVMLLDEPLSDLDVAIRKKLIPQFKEALRMLSVPVVYVTHDMLEARLVGTRFAFISAGRLTEVGSAEEAFKGIQRSFDQTRAW